MEVFSFKKLSVYQKSVVFVKNTYMLLRKFPKEEQYALCDQLHRAAVSITSNIAEGSSRFSKKEFAHFLEISYGSLMEVMSQLEVALQLGYITQDDLSKMEASAEEIAKMLNALRHSLNSTSTQSQLNSTQSQLKRVINIYDKRDNFDGFLRF